jgi:hypothetical protein
VPDFGDSRSGSPAADDISGRIRRVLLEELARCADGAKAADIASGASRHNLSAEEKCQCRSILLSHLGKTPEEETAERLVCELTQLDPTSDDLAAWRTWAAEPTAKLLAAARCNSKFPEWFKLLSIPVAI